MNDDAPDLGFCCNCPARATAIVMLHRRAPVPGTGWGCVVCDLPSDGALAVLCDACGDAFEKSDEPLRQVCVGYPKDNRRLPYGDLAPGAFDHDAAKHLDDPPNV
jgi:hypothetical protein